jgi:glutaredoxin 3
VVIFSKSYCGYCRSTKKVFESLPQANDVKVHELDGMGPNGGAIQRALLQLTGQQTVPNVFIHSKHVGGNDAVSNLYNSKKLQSML